MYLKLYKYINPINFNSYKKRKQVNFNHIDTNIKK